MGSSEESVRRLVAGSPEAEHARMHSARMLPGQDPDKFFIELDTHPEYLNEGIL